MSDPLVSSSSFLPATPETRAQAVVSVGVLLTAAGLALGAIDIPSNAGYGGVGPNFLPWLVAVVLAV